MAAGNKIAVITLADRPDHPVEYTDDAVRLKNAVGRLFATPQSGMTLLDGIVETVNGPATARNAARASSCPSSPTASSSRTATSATSSRRWPRRAWRCTSSAIGPFYHAEEHGTRERSFLLDAGPRESGGQRISLLSAHGLDGAMEKLAQGAAVAVQSRLQPAGVAHSA